ncbi:MAG: hypothetical protein QOE70_6435 [Chthoniobacter sp.]|jgi:nucleoside-diphosphate-sugar epimerase|nr:hypothetical protein [Chthoniobacter sp.]
MKVAIVGASGFVGTRLVEAFVLGKVAEVVPVVRSFSSLAVLSRFDLPWKVCDVLNVEELARAFAGCDAVIHAALGDPVQIVKMAESIYAAADQANVKRLVALSSASVHGLAPASGTNESSPLHEKHSSDYNNAKVRAERVMLKLRQRGNVELVLLRPSIVYGPRCRLLATIARQLLDGTAFLVGEGEGICNGIYVDNLIEAIRRSLESARADGETFLVADAEAITWRAFHAKVADALGVNMDSVHRVAAPAFRRSFKERVEAYVATPFAQRLLPAVPGQAKRLTKVLLAGLKEPPRPNAWTLPNPPSCIVDEEMATLQQCTWKYPGTKAAELLSYAPNVSFDEGMRRSIGWLGVAGYPLKKR